MVFVDLTKAFGTVNREALWKVLRKHGIPNCMLSVIMSFHQGMKGAVVSGGRVSKQFGVFNGTKQVCVIAPVLFAWYFSVMLQYAYAGSTCGVQFKFRTSGGLFNDYRFKTGICVRSSVIRDLLFADDAALGAASLEEAQEAVDRFSNAWRAFGLTISLPSAPKQIRGVKQKLPVHWFPNIPITVIIIIIILSCR